MALNVEQLLLAAQAKRKGGPLFDILSAGLEGFGKTYDPVKVASLRVERDKLKETQTMNLARTKLMEAQQAKLDADRKKEEARTIERDKARQEAEDRINKSGLKVKEVRVTPSGTETIYESPTPKLSGPALLKKQTMQHKEKSLLNNTMAKFDSMIKEAEDIKSDPGLSVATGKSAVLALVPGSPAYRARVRVNTLKSKTGFNVLQEMRASSPTGGALGQVSDRENQLLQDNISTLDMGQSEEDFKASLDRVIEYAKSAKQRLQASYDEFYGDMEGFKPTSERIIEDVGPKPGDVEDGFQFIGGDPTDPSNWRPE